ncbi:hypothetical protein [Methylocella sp.]|uniref:hypothetical protein n=1 Tax=Methylocella sp. TaxID=1978226 RepID=UPI0037843842
MSEAAELERSTGPDGRKSARLYCLALGVAAFAFLALGFVLPQTDWAIRRAGKLSIANTGYVTTLGDRKCDVVIYGDSTALVGLDPGLIAARTGLPTCNIAEYAGMTMVNGTLVPDLYLERRPSPKVWVFNFAPENLAPYHAWDTVSLYEAILFRLREKPDFSTFWLLLTHPKDAMGFATLGARISLTGLLKPPLRGPLTQLRADHLGRLPLAAPALTNCQSEKREHAADPAYVEMWRSRYDHDGAVVLVNQTPEPECDPTLDFYRSHPAPTDNRLETYPVSAFNTSGRLHMTQAGWTRYSGEVADQIVAALQRKAASGAGAVYSKAND